MDYSFNELGSTRPKFTERIQRDVYDAIDPSKSELALPGKTVLVTGGGRGIGPSIAESFAKAHVKAIILTGRNETSIINAKANFEKIYPDVQFFTTTVDVGSSESVDNLFKSLKGKVDTIDILINNAGVLNEYGPRVGDTSIEKYLEAMSINANGAYFMARGQIQFNPPDHPATYITLTTGINEPYPLMTTYMLSKATPVRMVELLNLEYPNLRTFAFLPGLVPTDLVAEERKPYALDKAPLSGGLSVWLCHPHADFLSGRFLDARWDIEQVVERKDEIVKNDWLKLQIGGY